MPSHLHGILNAVSGARDLDGFVERALAHCIERVGCSGGSVFILHGATGTLELQHSTISLPGPTALHLGEGIAGRAFDPDRRPYHIAEGEQLRNEYALLEGSSPDRYGALVTVPVYYSDQPQAVICLDFMKEPAAGWEAMSEVDRNRCEDLSAEIAHPSFGCAFRRVREYQSRIDILEAGKALAGQRRVLSAFLTEYLDTLSNTRAGRPDVSYVQLVDRRRLTIRTVHGVGFPLSFQASASHTLVADGSAQSRAGFRVDIQSYIVHTRRPHLIVGNYTTFFDQAVYETYQHHRYVRLWLPLFPFPPTLLSKFRDGKSEEAFGQFLRWREPERVGDAICVTADWTDDLAGGPPGPLVYGTLEVGFRRKDTNQLSLAPLEPDIATLCAAHAYQLSGGYEEGRRHIDLYRSTLAGSIDAIGRAAAAVMWPAGTELIVPMPNWQTPEIWTYPVKQSPWHVAVPTRGEAPEPAPEFTARVDFCEAPDASAHDVDADLREPLKKSVEEAVRLALRLDDQAADLYTLVETAEEQQYVGTRFPDPRLPEILQEICRESGAESCAHFVFEHSSLNGEGSSCSRVGGGHVWPYSQEPRDPSAEETALIDKVLESRRAEYGKAQTTTRGHSLAALPLSLADQVVAVIVLSYPAGIELNEYRRMEIEGRVGRWVYRLSLRHLLVRERFVRLAADLREGIRRIRDSVAEQAESRHIDRFAETLLSEAVKRLRLIGSVLTVFSSPETGPRSVERYWLEQRKHSSSQTVMHDRFFGEPLDGPCMQAVNKGEMLVYGSRDSGRVAELKEVVQDFRSREQQLEADGDYDRLENLRQLLALIESEVPSTVLVIPVPCRERPNKSDRFQAALTVILPGTHHFTQTHKQLIKELGSMIGDAFTEVSALDVQTYEKAGGERLEDLREKLAKSRTSDEIVGHLLRALGSPPSTTATPPHIIRKERWRLSNDIVLWELSSDERELVARSWRGGVADVLGGMTVLDPRNHPFFAKADTVRDLVQGRLSRLTNFRPWTLELLADSDNPILRAYAGLKSYTWLLTFPLARADQKVFGVVDCLRREPLVPHEESALRVLLRRLSLQVYEALDRSFYEGAFRTARYLTDGTDRSFQAMRAHEAYTFLVDSAKGQLGFEHCDLFLERDGALLLYASTRLGGALPEDQRAEYRVHPDSSGSVLVRAALHGGPQVSHRGTQPDNLDLLSPTLREHLKDDYRFERLAIPLGSGSNGEKRVTGLVYLRGPLSNAFQSGLDQSAKAVAEQSAKAVKKTGLIASEHVRRATDLAIVVHRIARMAGLVEQQGWLIDELQHSFGQRVQVVRLWSDDCLRSLARSSVSKEQVSKLRHGLRRAFDQFHETRTNLEIYARIATHFETPIFRPTDLAALIDGCCELMDPQAGFKSCRIVRYPQRIQPVWAHDGLLRTALWNLLDNAIKYSWDGREIEVTLTESRGIIRLIVENYGVGIPQPDLKRIFEPYARSLVPDAKGARRGSGIGLAVVKHIVETIHTGDVVASSDPPQGAAAGQTPEQTANRPYVTTFTVTLSRSDLERAGSGMTGKEGTRGRS